MEYVPKNLESNPGLNQSEALIGLQTHPTWKQGSLVKSLRKRGNVWVAEVLEPKTAEFPPGEDEGGGSDTPPKDDKPKDDAPSDDEGSSDGPPGADGPPTPGDKPGEDKGPEAGKGNTEEQILHVLTQLLHAVQGGGTLNGPGPDDALGPDPLAGGGPPPPKGPAGPPGPPGAGGPPGAKAPKGPPAMKPGMTPPGGTPVGAPAFASVTAAGAPVNPAAGTPVPQGGQPGAAGQGGAGGVCPMDGNPEPCPVHSQAGLNGMVASYSGKASTINLTSQEPMEISAAVAEAKPVVENYGYAVKQARYDEHGYVHILASRHK